MPDTTSAEEGKGQKREAEDSSSDSDDDFVGPSITDAAPVKKKRVLQYEKVYLGRWYCDILKCLSFLILLFDPYFDDMEPYLIFKELPPLRLGFTFTRQKFLKIFVWLYYDFR